MSQSYGLGKIMNGMRSEMRSESAEESGIDVPESVSLNSES